MAVALRTAPLLALDPGLGAGLTPAERTQALREALVPVVDLERGSWNPTSLAGRGGRPFALLIVEGMLVREIVVGDVVTSEMLGPGDLVETATSLHELVPIAVHWTVADTACLAVLDLRTRMFLHRWPAIGTTLIQRSVDHAARNGTHRAINQLPRVEDRVLAMFGYMAERWGRVGPSGIIVPLALTHEALGRLVGARRPTISLALRELAELGYLARREDGGWVLRFDAPRLIGTDAPSIAAAADVRPTEPVRPRRAGAHPLPEVTRADQAALRARIDGLGEAHTRRRQRIEAMLTRSADVRARIAQARERRSR